MRRIPGRRRTRKGTSSPGESGTTKTSGIYVAGDCRLKALHQLTTAPRTARTPRCPRGSSADRFIGERPLSGKPGEIFRIVILSFSALPRTIDTGIENVQIMDASSVGGKIQRMRVHFHAAILKIHTAPACGVCADRNSISVESFADGPVFRRP